MKIRYKQRIFFYFLIVFALFAICVIVIEQREERNQRTQTLEDRLDSYAEMIHTYIDQFKLKDSSLVELRILAKSMPMDIRMTIIDKDGKVTFDKDVEDINRLDNHLNRPEIRSASYQNTGSNIRISASTHHEYLYYAKNYKV